MTGASYEVDLQGVREFFAHPGGVPSNAEVDGRPAFTVKGLAQLLELSETRAGDILVELERSGELMRAKHGRAFIYWRPDTEPAATEVISIARDEDCPQCGWPETFAEGTAGGGSYRFGCRKCGWTSDAQGVPAAPPADPSTDGKVPHANTAEELVLELLQHLGGQAYCGVETSAKRRTVEMTAALALEERGLVRLVSRRSYMVAELVDEDARTGTPQPAG